MHKCTAVAALLWCCPLSALTLEPPFGAVPCHPYPHTDPHGYFGPSQRPKPRRGANRAERAPQVGAALQLAMLLDGCAVGVHALAVPRVQPPLVFRCAPTTCPYAPSTCTFAPCKGQCRSLGVVSRRGVASLRASNSFWLERFHIWLP